MSNSSNVSQVEEQRILWKGMKRNFHLTTEEFIEFSKWYRAATGYRKDDDALKSKMYHLAQQKGHRISIGSPRKGGMKRRQKQPMENQLTLALDNPLEEAFKLIKEVFQSQQDELNSLREWKKDIQFLLANQR
jgi:hypothetical protein